MVAVKLLQQTLISSFGEPTLFIQQVQNTQFLAGARVEGERHRGRSGGREAERKQIEDEEG